MSNGIGLHLLVPADLLRTSSRSLLRRRYLKDTQLPMELSGCLPRELHDHCVRPWEPVWRTDVACPFPLRRTTRRSACLCSHLPARPWAKKRATLAAAIVSSPAQECRCSLHGTRVLRGYPLRQVPAYAGLEQAGAHRNLHDMASPAYVNTVPCESARQGDRVPPVGLSAVAGDDVVATGQTSTPSLFLALSARTTGALLALARTHDVVQRCHSC